MRLNWLQRHSCRWENNRECGFRAHALLSCRRENGAVIVFLGCSLPFSMCRVPCAVSLSCHWARENLYFIAQGKPCSLVFKSTSYSLRTSFISLANYFDFKLIKRPMLETSTDGIRDCSEFLLHLSHQRHLGEMDRRSRWFQFANSAVHMATNSRMWTTISAQKAVGQATEGNPPGPVLEVGQRCLGHLLVTLERNKNSDFSLVANLRTISFWIALMFRPD